MDRNALLNQVIQNFGGDKMNPGQQIAVNQVSGDLGFNPQQVALALAQRNSADAVNSSLDFSGSPISGKSGSLKGFPVTQPYGNVNPGVERFSRGGVNTGVDIGVPKNTPVSLPSGQWKVLKAFNGAKSGYVGDNENSGYGNSILVQNLDTGEQLRFSHLNQLNIPSEVMKGGQIIGLSGATGNVTGPHLDITYKDAKGNLGDFMSTPYANQLGL